MSLVEVPCPQDRLDHGLISTEKGDGGNGITEQHSRPWIGRIVSRPDKIPVMRRHFGKEGFKAAGFAESEPGEGEGNRDQQKHLEDVHPGDGAKTTGEGEETGEGNQYSYGLPHRYAQDLSNEHPAGKQSEGEPGDEDLHQCVPGQNVARAFSISLSHVFGHGTDLGGDVPRCEDKREQTEEQKCVPFKVSGDDAGGVSNAREGQQGRGSDVRPPHIETDIIPVEGSTGHEQGFIFISSDETGAIADDHQQQQVTGYDQSVYKLKFIVQCIHRLCVDVSKEAGRPYSFNRSAGDTGRPVRRLRSMACSRATVPMPSGISGAAGLSCRMASAKYSK